jgi:hypothetical protein
MTLKCIFDVETGLDGTDPLGSLIISDERSRIVIEPTFFDSWLVSLIGALPRLRAPGRVNVEIDEEPYPIEVEVAVGGHLVISYRGQKALAENVREFESALRTAVSAFLAAIESTPTAWQNRDIDPIRRFWWGARN